MVNDEDDSVYALENNVAQLSVLWPSGSFYYNFLVH